jgi:hypothetical protein
MHNCATFTAAVYINALQGTYRSGKHRHDALLGPCSPQWSTIVRRGGKLM